MKTIIEMPDPAFSGWDYDSLPAVQRDGYTADQMREYAKRAIAEEREARAKVVGGYCITCPLSFGAEATRAKGNT